MLQILLDFLFQYMLSSLLSPIIMAISYYVCMVYGWSGIDKNEMKKSTFSCIIPLNSTYTKPFTFIINFFNCVLLQTFYQSGFDCSIKINLTALLEYVDLYKDFQYIPSLHTLVLP